MEEESFFKKALGYIVPNASILVVAFVTKELLAESLKYGGGSTLVASEFVILPLLMGIFSAWFWRDVELSSKNIAGRSAISGLIAIMLSYLFLGEGTICLIIVSPLLWGFIFIGMLIGKAAFKRDNTKLNVSVVSLLILIFIADASTKHHYQNMVADKITINAPATKVWPYVVAYKRIEKPAGYFLFRLGMPSPVQSTVTAYKLGAGRKCVFSNGYTFEEKITEYEPNHKLTFAITEQPRDPEIMGHIDIQQGQFILRDNGDGTTTLTGNSWYALHVFPIWYYDLWAESVTRNVHLRVMDHIKELSEGK